LETTGITHIVSALRYNFKDFEDWEKYKQITIDVNDVEDENMLEEFPRAVKFINDAFEEGGKVLVHW
jgi:dual specificity phosphatase 12